MSQILSLSIPLRFTQDKSTEGKRGFGILSMITAFENLNSFPDAIFGANMLT